MSIRQQLDAFTTDQLLEEVVRRRNQSESRKPVEAYCDACAHFRAYTGRGEAPDSWSCCSKGHKQSFRMPEDWESPHTEDFGFYRRVCADRTEVVA